MKRPEVGLTTVVEHRRNGVELTFVLRSTSDEISTRPTPYMTMMSCVMEVKAKPMIVDRLWQDYACHLRAAAKHPATAFAGGWKDEKSSSHAH